MLPLHALKASDLNWPSAYAAKRSKYLTLTSQTLFLNILPAECFLSEDQYTLKAFIDTGRGFTTKAHQTIPLRSNPNRSFFAIAKIFSVKRAVKQLQIMLSFSKAFVRILSLRLTAFSKTKIEPTHQIFFESPSCSQDLICLAEKQVDHNTYYVEDGLRLILNYENTDTYHIKLKLCCEMFLNTSLYFNQIRE